VRSALVGDYYLMQDRNFVSYCVQISKILTTVHHMQS